MLPVKDLIAVGSLLWTTTSFAIYGRSIFQGKTKPHLFSWLIWGVLTCVGAAAQFASKGGNSALTLGYVGLLCLGVAVASLKYGEKHIVRSDWVTLILSFSAIPLWLLTNDPLSAVVLVSLINAVGYLPTYRKSYISPHQENITAFAMAVPNSLLILASVDSYSLTTVLHPASMVLGNSLLVFMLIWRRRVVSRVSYVVG